MPKIMRIRKKPVRAIWNLVILASVLISWPASAGPLVVTVSQARNDSGQVRCGLFNHVEGWRQEKRAMRAIDAAIKNGKALCDFGVVPQGNYAIAIFHAEDGESSVIYGFLGKPKQGVGFSNNPSITFGAPDFKTALVPVGTESLEIEITLRY